MWPSLDQSGEPKINFLILNFKKLNLFLYVWCVCMHCVCAYVWECGHLGTIACLWISEDFPICLRQILLPSSLRVTGWLTPEILGIFLLLSHCMSAEMPNVHCHVWFYTDSGNLNSSLHICTTNVLCTDSFP